MNKLFMMINAGAVALCAMTAWADASKTAYWVGGGDRANVNDPANWTVTDSQGVAVANAVPDADTAVVISGETDFNCPVGQTLTYESLTIGDCTLTAECDWRGLTHLSSPAYIDPLKDSYVDTGFKPNQNTRVVMDVTVNGPSETWFGVSDADDVSYWKTGAFAAANDGHNVYLGFGNDDTGGSGSVVANGRHTLDYYGGVFMVDGTEHSRRSAQTFQLSNNLYLFTHNKKGRGIISKETVPRFHSCQIYDNGTLVRDYVPTNNGAVFGLHDKVNGTFSPSASASVPFNGETIHAEINGVVDLAGHSLTLADTAGSGTITDSSGSLDVPKGYFIDTGFKPNQDTRVVMDVTVQGVMEYWFGCWDSNWNAGAFAAGNDKVNVYTGFGNSGGGNGAVISNGRHTLDYDKGTFKCDGAVHTARSGQTFQLKNALYLFAQNRKGTPTAGADQGNIRFHSCQIYDNGTLVRNYVPAKSGTAFGLYDKVGRTFKALGGSGEVAVSGVVAAGELRIDVQGFVENTSLEIAGALTLVKEGAGMFTAAKVGQSYSGGTVVSNGWAKSGVGSAPWGTAKSLVTVADGAAFDWAGVHSMDGTSYSFAIEGDGPDGTGSLVNSQSTHPNYYWRCNCLGDLYLNGNATISGRPVFGFTLSDNYPSYKHTLALNDHTLSIRLRSDNRDMNQQFFAFRGVKAVNGGTISFSTESGGTNTPYVSFYTTSSDLSGVTVDICETMGANLEETPTIGTLIDRRSILGYDGSNNPFVVLDTFKPMTTNLVKTVTLGGVTNLSPVLDLSALDGPFVLPASGATLGAAEGATVRIDVGDRRIKSSVPLISWTTRPAGVTFTWVDDVPTNMGSLVVKDDGLYVETGTILIFR